MAGKRGGTGEKSESSKKVQGQARKAEAAANKQAAKQREIDEVEAEKWAKGEKDTSKKAAAAAKAAEAARKKAERDALEAAEAATLTTKAKSGNAKTAQKKTRGLDLSQLEVEPATAGASLNASGIDNALDALSLASPDGGVESVDRHPERRVKAAFTVYEARRLEEMKDDKGLRRNQKVELIRREFEKSPENPMNQVSAYYNSTKDEVMEIRKMERAKVEKRLVGT